MWSPAGIEIDPRPWERLVPEDVLFEFEEPLTFVARDGDGQPLLVHSITADAEGANYVVVATDARILDDLKAGRLDILGALRQPRCWVADLGQGWQVRRVWSILFGGLPKELLPRSGAMLTPELESLFRIRLIGPGVGPGRTSAADIRMAAQAAESGLRGLARVAFDQKKRAGQVPRELRYYSNPPYQYSRVASFEIAFGRPRDNFSAVDDEVFSEMGRLLERGLKALRANADDLAPIEGLNEDQTVQLFEAIKALTPPTRGGIDRVEVGGEMVEHASVPRVLTRDDRVRSVRRIKSARKPPRKEAPFRIAGVVEEADQGMFTFTLRQLEPRDIPTLDGAPEVRFEFEDHLFDAVSDAWNSQERVFVVAERIGAAFKALDLQFANDSPLDGADEVAISSE